MAERIPKYDELKLRLEKEAPGSYIVLAFAPDGRTGRGIFVPPVTDDELDDFVRGVGLVRRTRRSGLERMEEVESFGSKLFAALVKDQVGEVYQAARAAADDRGHGLRITLQLSGAPELMRLPWEFLYRRPRFLSQSIRTPLVRSLDHETARRPQKVELPLRILGMVSSPTGYPELNADDERLKLEKALSRLLSNGLVDLQWLESATLGELGRRIAEPDDIHVLHYIGHGAYDEVTESGILVLETPHGRAHDVSGREIGTMLQDEEGLRLVVLNSCEGARTSRIDPFSGVAASLVEFEIPAVIGMQFEITDEAAIAFSDSLYTALAQGLPVDAALGPARRAIIGAQKEAEFGTPVLFLRAADARLFEVETPLPRHPTTDSDSTGPAPARSQQTGHTLATPRAELLRSDKRSRVFRVALQRESHLVECRLPIVTMAFVAVNGTKVARKSAAEDLMVGVRSERDSDGKTIYTRIFQFSLTDGPDNRVEGRIEVISTGLDVIRAIKLMIDSHEVYSGD